MPTFEGFPPDALALLDALPMRDRDWYRGSKQEIDAALLEPAKALVELIDEGATEPLASASRTFKEWAGVLGDSPEVWAPLIEEAVVFARAQVNA